MMAEGEEWGKQTEEKGKNLVYVVHPALSSTEISKGNVWSFCHPRF